MQEIYSELDFVYICSDGKKFITEEDAKKHEEKLSEGKTYGIFNRQNKQLLLRTATYRAA